MKSYSFAYSTFNEMIIMGDAIAVNALSKSYGKFKAVDDISFNVKEGTIFGFLGPNGAGKTTTIRILTCQMPPTSCKGYVCGMDVTG